MEFVRRVRNLVREGEEPAKIQQTNLEGWGLTSVQLRPYQLEGVTWLAERYCSGRGCILGDEMGLGKTLQSISLLLYLCCEKKVAGPFLILCPLSVVSNWQSEFSRFAPQLEVLCYSGDKESREQQRDEIAAAHVSSHVTGSKHPFHVMLSHYEVVLKDSAFLQKFPWQCLIVDEGHRLKNPSSVLHGLLKQFSVEFRLLLTGTPVQNNLKELYALLSFVAPKVFPIAKLENFVAEFASVKDDAVLAGSLHTILQPFLLRRIKSEVLLDLPNKSEVVLYTGFSALQKKYYKAILMKDISAFSEAGTKTSLMNILVQLRKCVNHPYLFDGVEPEPFELGEHLVEASGKLFIIDKLLAYLKSRRHRVLMFSQMTRMLDIIQDYLGYRGYSYERLDGSVRGEERFLAVKNFSEDEETFIFLLSTRAGGQGLNLAGADTVIFVDSDFNPQNDLQAAARAHRIGQTRPVKVIRLVGRDSVEEIILKRAHTKLELTNTVIEGGQFSHGAVSATPSSAQQLSDVLKFGLDKLLQSDESTIVDEDLESILGVSEEGKWISAREEAAEGQRLEEEEDEGAMAEEFEAPENMYVYEGEDYSKPNEADKKTFDELLAEQLKLSDDVLGERVLRSVEQREPSSLALHDVPQRKRKQLTPDELAQRQKKREEARIKRMKLLGEKEQKRLEEKQKKKLEFWQRNNYTSLNAPLSDDSSEESAGSDDEFSTSDPSDREIHYVVGDVTQPRNAGDNDAIVVHCVDDSGRWGKGGLFSALGARSLLPQSHYELAGRMRDLSLGDSHMVAIDDRMTREKGRDTLALIVAQSREPSGRLSAIKLSALSTGLQRVARTARRDKASVHLPRIGHSTPNFNWYGTERLIRKYLASRGVPTYIYYFPRTKQQHHTVKKTSTSSDTTDAAASSMATASNIVSYPASAELKQRAGYKATSNTPTSSLLPVGCDPLPDTFTGLVIYFHNVDLEHQRKLSRYIIAYNGDVVDTITPQTTHVVYDDQVKPLSLCMPGWSHAETVTVQWLEDCLRTGELLSAT